MSIRIDRAQLIEATRLQLRSWHNFADTADSLFSTLFLVRQELADKDAAVPSMRRLAVNQVLWDGIKYLQDRESQLAQLLSYRYPENLTMKGTAVKLKLSPNQVKHLQVQAIEALADVLLARELAMRQEHIDTMLAQLPQPTYTRLVGVEAIQALCEQLLIESEHWLCAVVGIGGVGKTALADSLTRHIIRTAAYQHVAWIWIAPDEGGQNPFSAETLITQLWQQLLKGDSAQVTPPVQLAQLRHHLKNEPTFIVVDNLETADQLALVCDSLRPLTNPSRVLITSREHPALQQNMLTHVVRTLSQAAAYELLREYGAADLAQADDKQLQQIWQLTGGHPLALKLVAGLATVLPLPSILAEFTTVETVPIADLYNSIYRRVYHSLTANARRLLRIMPLAGGGGMPIDQMAAISQLPKDQLWAAIQELVQRSLLEPSGSTWQRTYRIHRLTQAFLQTEIVQLPEKDEQG